MMELSTNPDYDAITRRAHQMRAEAVRDMFAAVAALFKRKPQVKAVHA